MKVFSLYKKIFKSYFIVVIIYVTIFLSLAIALSQSSDSNSMFSETKINVSLNNLDSNSDLSEGLVEYLSKFVDYVDIKEDDIKDALYFEQISTVITIPKNFQTDLIGGKDVEIIQDRLEQNVTTIAIDRAINKYINYVKVYLEKTDKAPIEVASLVKDVLANESVAINLVEESDQLTSSAAYYRILSYIINAVILTVVGFITISFRKFDVRRRLIVSPYPIKKANLDMIFGNLLFAIALTTLLSGVSIILFPKVMFTLNGLILIINSFVFALAALSMSYFMSLLIRNEQVLSGVNNVYSLGSAFLTGAFVPQFLLGSGILAFAHILPNYYYIYNVELVTSTSNLSSANISKVIIYLFIQVLFTIAFIIFSILLSKKQARSES